MKPNTSYNARQIVDVEWNFTSNGTGTYALEQITTAAALDLANTMRRIERLLLNLGDDGIHALIRYEAARVRKAERLKRQRAAAKRRRTIAARKAAQG